MYMMGGCFMPDKKDSFIKRYGVNFTEQEYVVNPAIGREMEIKQLSLVLLTPDKSAILTGKPGIGKTAIVEGLAYLIQRNEVPDALKGYTIIKVDTQALMGTVQETGDSRVQTLIDEILEHEKYILFIDEIHTLINATNETALDFANMFKTGLGRGDLKVIGATTSDEYERYILRDKAFTRRFQRIDVAEPDQDMTTKIVVGVIPRIEHATGIKMAYTPFIREKLARFVVELTTEYNRVYETAGRYPDVPITLFSQAFSEALFDNKNVVTATHIRKAIENSKAVYPDVIKKYLVVFDQKFKDLLDDDRRDHEGLIIKDSNNSNKNSDNNIASSNSEAVKSEAEDNISTNSVNNANPFNKLRVDEQESNYSPVSNSNTSNNVNEPATANNIDKKSNDEKIDSISELNNAYDMIVNPFSTGNN